MHIYIYIYIYTGVNPRSSNRETLTIRVISESRDAKKCPS